MASATISLFKFITLVIWFGLQELAFSAGRLLAQGLLRQTAIAKGEENADLSSQPMAGLHPQAGQSDQFDYI